MFYQRKPSETLLHQRMVSCAPKKCVLKNLQHTKKPTSVTRQLTFVKIISVTVTSIFSHENIIES
jgi:hypothetical protein